MAECRSAGLDMWVCPPNTKHNLVCLLTLSLLYCWIASPTSQQRTVQSLNLPSVGCCMHTKITGKVSSTFLTESLLWDRHSEVTQLPKQMGNLGRMACLKFMACVGSLTLFVLFFFSLKLWALFVFVVLTSRCSFSGPGRSSWQFVGVVRQCTVCYFTTTISYISSTRNEWLFSENSGTWIFLF